MVSGVYCECILLMELGVVSKLHILKVLLRFPLTRKKIMREYFSAKLQLKQERNALVFYLCKLQRALLAEADC